MNKSLLPAVVFALCPLGITSAVAHEAAKSVVANAPPAEPYKAVSSLVKLPDFIPGMGQLYVDPSTLPAGPFLSYDRDGRLVSTVYMLPISQMQKDLNLDDLKAPGGNVDHVDVMYNAGHPGVEEPHIHVVLWHVSSDEEARVAK